METVTPARPDTPPAPFRHLRRVVGRAFGGAEEQAVDAVSEISEARANRGTHLAAHERRAESLSAVAYVATAAGLALSARGGLTEGRPTIAILLVLLLGALGRVEFEIGRGAAVPTQLAFIPLAFLTPPAALPLEVLAGYLLAASFSTAPLERRLVLATSSCWFCVGPALVLLVAGEPRSPTAIGAFCGAVFAAQVLVDFVSWNLYEARLGPRRHVALRDAAWVYAIDAALTPLGLLVVLSARIATYALVLPLGVVALLALYRRERTERIDSLLELSDAYRGTALLLGCVIEGDDRYTAEHSAGVVSHALNVAGRLGIDDAPRLREIEFAALLHDIGKIRVPKRILRKNGTLDAHELEVMREHPTIGADMLTSAGGLLARIAPAVRHHHEHWDGGGYPDGLQGEEIPLAARIVAVCDAYDAMTTDRPYRPAMTHLAAYTELTAHAGTQFDPAIVRALVGALREAAAEERAAAA